MKERTKFRIAVEDTEKTLAELSRIYARKYNKTEEVSYKSGIRFFNEGVRNFTISARDWAELLGKAFHEIQEDK